MESRKASGLKEQVLQLLDALCRLPLTEQSRQYAGELRKSIIEERFLVAVLATWNTGKSTFINALEGEPLLPMQNKETTHIVNRLRYSGRRYVMIHFKKEIPGVSASIISLVRLLGLEIKKQSSSFIEIPCPGYQDQRAVIEMLSTDDGYLDKYGDIYKKVFHEDLVIPFPDFDAMREKYRELHTDEATEPDGEVMDRWIVISGHFREKCLRRIQDAISEIELGVPLPLLRHGIEILDTPGAESFEEMRDEVLENYIKFAQCVVFIFRFDQPGATEDIEFRRIIQEYGIEDVFLVLNRIDGARNPEEQWDALAQVRQNLHKFVKGEIYLYPVSSLGALIARLSKESRKGQPHPFIQSHARFVKRTDNAKFKEYYAGFQKFYEDLDGFLGKVDKFRKIIQAAVNFIAIETENIESRMVQESGKKEQSAEFRKLLENEKRLESIWTDWREEISKVIARLEEELQGNVPGEAAPLQIEGIIQAGMLTKSEFRAVARFGFPAVMNAVIAAQLSAFRLLCDDWVTAKPIGMIGTRRIGEYVTPNVKRIGDATFGILNSMLECYYADARELSCALGVKLAEWIHDLFPVSGPVAQPSEIQFIPSKTPELSVPLPSFWGKIKERGKRIFRRNEIELREEFREVLKEICASVEHQLRSHINREVSAQTQRLVRTLDRVLDEQMKQSRTGIRDAFELDHEKGFRIRASLNSLNDKIKESRILLKRAGELKKTISPEMTKETPV